MDLFLSSLKREVKKLHKGGIRLRIIGDISQFSEKLQQTINEAEELTKDNRKLALNIAANYGGRWDITEAVRKIALKVEYGDIKSADITEDMLHQQISLNDLPEPDLFIRTGGEQRVSNFLLWQLAYCEFYFSDLYWPEFDRDALEQAVISFGGRQRRFGRIEEQLQSEEE
jgi:undecaprenyl diphosphate synthase